MVRRLSLILTFLIYVYCIFRCRIIVPFLIFVSLTFWRYRTKYVLAFSLLLFLSFNIWLNALGFPTGNLSDTLLKVQFFAGFLVFLANKTIVPIILILLLLLPDNILSSILYNLTTFLKFKEIYSVKKFYKDAALFIKTLLAIFIMFFLLNYISILFYQFPFGPLFPYKEAFTNAVVETAKLMIDTGALRCFDYKYNGNEKILFIWGKDSFITEDDILNVLNDTVEEITCLNNTIERTFLTNFREILKNKLEKKYYNGNATCIDIYTSMIEAFRKSYLSLQSNHLIDYIEMRKVSPLLKLVQKAKPLSGIDALDLKDVPKNKIKSLFNSTLNILNEQINPNADYRVIKK